MAKTHERDGLTFIKGQVAVDATSGVVVVDMSVVEFETAGTATLTYNDATTKTYTFVNAGTRVGLRGSDVASIAFTGNISFS